MKKILFILGLLMISSFSIAQDFGHALAEYEILGAESKILRDSVWIDGTKFDKKGEVLFYNEFLELKNFQGSAYGRDIYFIYHFDAKKKEGLLIQLETKAIVEFKIYGVGHNFMILEIKDASYKIIISYSADYS